MSSILLKNYYYFRHNKSELLMLLLTSFLEILPLYLMGIGNQILTETIWFMLVSYVFACFVLNVSVSICFEYFKELDGDKYYHFTLSNVKLIQFSFAQVLFFSFLYSIIFSLTIIFFGFFLNINFNLKFDILFIFKLIFISLVLISNLTALNKFLIILVRKVNNFSVAAMMCNLLMIVSGCFSNAMNFNIFLRIFNYFNPYFYLILIIKSMLNMQNNLSIIWYVLCAIVTLMFSLLAYLKKD
ncbi:MAG: hypothetical protein RR623_06790 [Bacilli bacterium]